MFYGVFVTSPLIFITFCRRKAERREKTTHRSHGSYPIPGTWYIFRFGFAVEFRCVCV